jgi:hypothetical protein
VHCLIIRGLKGTVVRRWCRETRLNGRDFDDSWLQPGDRLDLGQIELEVLADRLPDAVPSVPRETVAAGGEDGENVLSASVPATEVESTPSETEPADDLRRQFEERLKRLLEHQQLVTERERELAIRQSEFEAEREQWSQEREAQLAELDVRDDCLRSLREEIDAERQALIREKQAGQPEDSEGEMTTEDVEQERVELAESQRQRNGLEAAVDQLGREGDPSQGAEFLQEALLPETHSSSAANRRASDLPQSPPADANADAEVDADADAEVDADADAEVDAEPVADFDSELDTSPDLTDSEVGLPPTEDDYVREEDEFSIDDYMSKLLQRVGGRSEPRAVAAAPAASEKPVPLPKKAAPKTPQPSAKRPTSAQRPKQQPLDLVALRDVANRTARLAIERHISRVWLQVAIQKWCFAAICAIATGGFAYWMRRYSWLSVFGLGVGSLMTLYWASQAIRLSHRAIRARIAEKRASSDGQASIQEPPK